jgi:hypothetical protein
LFVINDSWLVFVRQHTRRFEWETFEGHEEFFDEVRRKGSMLGKRIVYEKRKKCVKNI